MSDTIVLIPARLSSTRLPGKPLAEIAGGADDRARDAQGADGASRRRRGGDRFGSRRRGGGKGRRPGGDDPRRSRLRLRPHLRGVGGARSRAPLRRVVNVQGDLPTLDPADIQAALQPLADPAVDIATLAAEIRDPAELTNPNVVKVTGETVAPGRLRATAFTRADAGGPACITTTSGSMFTGARRSRASSSCRRRPTSGARSSSNCARSTPACASTSPWSRACRSASTPAGTRQGAANFKDLVITGLVPVISLGDAQPS